MLTALPSTKQNTYDGLCILVLLVKGIGGRQPTIYFVPLPPKKCMHGNKTLKIIFHVQVRMQTKTKKCVQMYNINELKKMQCTLLCKSKIISNIPDSTNNNNS